MVLRAAVGACAGADLAFEAVALTCLVLAGNTLLRPLVNAINRAPIDQGGTEAIYEVQLTANAEDRDECRDLLREQSEAASYPSRASRSSSGTTMRSKSWPNCRAPAPIPANSIRSSHVLRTARWCITRAGVPNNGIVDMTSLRVVAVAALFLAGLTVHGAWRGAYVEEELRIPDTAAGPRGLEALLFVQTIRADIRSP